MSYILYPILALAPSLIWLLFYLRKDTHPESNGMILKVFIYGALATLPVAIIEIAAQEGIKTLFQPTIISSAIYFFLGVALTEELFKYLAVRKGVFHTQELDEPLDIMLYMIIGALGFAAVENLLYLWPGRYGFDFTVPQSIMLALQRFVGATFLHALISGTFGYFIAISFYKKKEYAKWFFIIGLSLAAWLHGLFNFSIMEVDGWLKPGAPLIILITLAIFVSWGFKRLKKLPSTCITSAKLTQNNM